MTEIRIGLSGWSYKEWRGGGFYPKGLPQRSELEYASSRVNSIEINGTFYSLQSPASFEKWAATVPEDFIFAVKGSKYITHQKRLRSVEPALANFFAQGVLKLGRKLGPVLWQFAPWYKFDQEALSAFLDLLPASTADAAALSRENTIKAPRKAVTELIEDVPLRYAFEVRHESFMCEEFIDLLRSRNAALAIADTAGKFPYLEDLTADFVYVRLHGSTELYASGYTSAELDAWAAKIRSWSQGREPRGAKKLIPGKFKPGVKRDVFVYFDNDIYSHAPFDAMELAVKVAGKKKGPGVNKTGALDR